MTIREVAQKERDLEAFNNVVALYYILKSNSTALRVKQAVYRADEVAALPLDFIIDVEIKTKRMLGESYYQLFLRAVYNEETEILPEYMREALGRLFQEYRLGPDGAYRKLYFLVKNEQTRSFMKEQNGRLDENNGAADSTFAC